MMQMSSLPTVYQDIISYSRYARYMPELKRRETWDETVDRLVDYLETKVPEAKKEIKEIREAVFKQDIMPSMRLMMTAGEACERDNISAYNCAYLAINNKRAFSEALYILMNGTGVGFSAERQETTQLT
jgi:ribonucleoside-triphosphate reductase